MKLNMKSKVLILQLLVTMTATVAFGQTDLGRFQRQLELIQRQNRVEVNPQIPLGSRALFDYGGYASYSFYAIDDLEGETHILRQTDVNGYLAVNLDNAHEFYTRVRGTYYDWNSGDDFDGRGDRWEERWLDRAWYQFDLRQAAGAYEGKTIDNNVRVKVGRQLVHWANGLTLSWEVDGLLLGGNVGVLDYSFLAANTVRLTSDIDSYRPNFDTSTDRDLIGGMLGSHIGGRHQVFVYGLWQDDKNGDAPQTVAGYDTRFNYNSYYIGAGAYGPITDQILYSAEFVYEGGDTYSTSVDTGGAAVAQTVDDIEAFAFDVTFDYLLNDANRSRLSAELLITPGDKDRVFHTTSAFGGNTSGTKDTAFNGFGLINTGLAFSPNASNLMMLRLGLTTWPLINNPTFSGLQVGADVFFYDKFHSDAPIDEPTIDGDRYLGAETDLFARWQITSDTTLQLLYGVYFPSDAIDGPDDPRHFLTTRFTLAF